MADFDPHRVDHPTERLVGKAPALVALRAQIRHLVAFDNLGSPHVPTVLLQGETGTGKGLVARVIHASGPRASGPFVEVNCAALPDTMLEAELFGFETGTFTDAKRAKPGLFEAASEGTLFLDEIDALPLGMQGKLLTAIETKRVRRLGSVVERTVDVKLIAASNTALAELLAAGRFRADLYHRLAVVVLALPPLRARGEDVLVLAKAYLQHYTLAHGVPPKRMSTEAEAWLHAHFWPGNVRELSHVMERVTLLHVGEEIDAAALTRLCLPLAAPQPAAGPAPHPPEPAPEDTLPAEAVQIRQALAQTGGNVVRAARLLGLSRDTVRYRMQRFGIGRPHLAAPPPSASPRSPGVDHEGTNPQRDALPLEAPPGLTPPFVQEEVTPPQGSARQDTPTAPHVPTPEPASDHLPVAVLALELTWPEVPDLESCHYDPRTEQVRWEQVIMDKACGFGGVSVQRTPSRLVWVFGVPQTLEQLPQRAVHSALAIRQMVIEASAPDLPPCPTVRLAVHLGAVRVDPQAPDPAPQVRAVGETLALPVRLLGQAAPGEILASPEVGRLVDGWVALEARRLHAGDPAGTSAYTIIGVSPRRGAWGRRRHPTRSPFVGRERELMLLDAIFEQVVGSRGQIVSVVGAPGMGKSRLLEEFRQRLIAPRVRYAQGHCLAYGSMVPYLPVLDLVRKYCGVAAGDGPEVFISKVGASLQQAGLDPDVRLPYLLHLLGMSVEADPLTYLSAEARKARTFEAIRQLFLTSSQQQPVILAVENMHWIDPTSEEFLTSLVDGLAGIPILVLVTFRPGYGPRWLDKSYATQIALQPLGLDDSRQVMRSVLRDTALGLALEQQLLARAEGNPFFLEELAYTVREHGEAHTPLAVPDTIHAVLAARMDRLPTSERNLLQAASVIGKDIPVPLLQAITALPEETLSRRLAYLQAAEFLSAAGGLPTGNYTFRHTLIQETAYQALLISTRRQYHQQTAQALAAHFPALAAAQPALLAHHYTAAGCYEQAVHYWQRAGQQASDRSAHLEAIRHCTTGIELLQTLPETPEHSQQALSLYIALGSALQVTKGHTAPEVEHAYTQAYALCQQVGKTPELVPVLFGLWRFYVTRSQLHTARALGDTLLGLAQQAHDPALSVIAHHALGLTGLYLGALPAARLHLEASIAHYTSDQRRAPVFRMGVDPGVGCRAHAAITLWLLGSPAQALARVHEALTLAHEVSQPFSLAWALCVAALVSQFRRDVPAVREHAEAAVALATEQGFPLWASLGTSVRGWALALQGQGEAGMAQVHQGIAAFRATGAAVFIPYFCTVLADVSAHLGHPEDGLQALVEAYTLVEQQEERWWEAEIARLRGVLLLKQIKPPEAEAETWLQRALDVARRQEAKALELRAAMSLSRLWQQQGKQVKARQLLEEVYGWFTEGFDTADLQEAKALLAELGG